MKFECQQALVLGLARSGLAATELLRREGARVRAVDSRAAAEISALPGLLAGGGVEFVSQAEADLAGIDFLVISPGVPQKNELIQGAYRLGLPVLGELELAYRFLRGPVMGISGSNGKTTTTALTGHILQVAGVAAQVGGNIGLPVTELIDSSREGQWNVLEISSFQLETVSEFHAQIASVLNVTPNHLDRHGDFATYAAAKGRIFANQSAADHAVLNAGNETSAAYATPARKHYFGGADARVEGAEILLEGQRLMGCAEAALPGRHNLENIMAAALLCRLAGAGREAIAEGVRSFAGVPHRLQFVREVKGVRYYNDSKATSVDATLKALEALDGPLWVILGGVDKGGSYLPLEQELRAKAKAVLLIGQATPVIAAELGGRVKLVECGDLETALGRASHEAVAGDTVLLAPACASYDQFKSFEQRGERFQALVKEL
jgi:UDP-N-acetylmuramoylalanine--D-glutamate ligase